MARIQRPIPRWLMISLGILGMAALVGGYEILSYRQHLRNPSDTTIPGFRQMWQGLVAMSTPPKNDLAAAFGMEEKPKSSLAWITDTPLFRDVRATYGRLLIGLVIGSVASIFLGLVMGCWPIPEAILVPPISLLAKVPGTAMLAVFFVLVGTNEYMFITMIAFGIMPTLTQAIYLSAKNDLHSEEIDKAYTLGASNFEVVFNVVFMTILPKVIESVRLQIGPAMVYLIAAEMLVGQVGLGYQIRMQQRLQNMSVVYDYILILGLSGLAMDGLMRQFRRFVSPWYERTTS